MNIPELPLQIAIWLGVLFFLVAGLNQLMTFAERFREKPTPSETYLLAQDHLRLEAQEAARMDRLESRQDEQQKKISAEISSLHKRIDAMPHEIIALLRNTGALK